MRRVIEDLVEKRKARQEELRAALRELAGALGKRNWPRRNDASVAERVTRLQEVLEAYVTAQDKEWDAYAGNHATTVFKSLEWKIEKLEAEYSNLRTLLAGFAQLENRLDRLLDGLDRRADAGTAAGLREVKERLSPLQYADFEKRFRGSRGEIAGRLSAYLGHFPPDGEVLDIGCGRGEFLALLRDSGRRGLGLDLSDSMLAEARDQGLECIKADALEFLKARPAASLDGVFSAQVAEHLEPEYLRRLVSECFRVLRPGAPLLLETVNPLSLFALSRIYFLDPGHVRPLHPEYLRYLLESSGFAAVEVLFGPEPAGERLAEVDPSAPQALAFNGNVDRLNRLLFGPSDYAALGRKPGPARSVTP
ncbi:MAG TPA: class I SAM-dependent methyltransferase [Candidatus Aminicenantes bacterium]|nr:class I SAM-dependent methyltransferase [Candidatus Aminicenantes bacterium]